MPLRPDIVVTKPDSPDVLLVVELKTGGGPPEDLEEQLKGYMAHSGCPAGMLVTLDVTRFFRNRYTGYGTESVEIVGECPTSDLFGDFPERVPQRGSFLEERVERWLENLQQGTTQSWPSAVREAVESGVLPAVLGGVIRAGGPRWLRRTGS